MKGFVSDMIAIKENSIVPSPAKIMLPPKLSDCQKKMQLTAALCNEI